MEGAHRIVSLRMGDLNARFPGLIQAILTALASKDTDGDFMSDAG
jgi:hypothetical protein